MSAESTSRNLEMDVVGNQNKSILLLGREGLGKSSTGNSILGTHVFKAKSYSLPDEESSVDGVSSRRTGITVVDGISVRDEDLSDKYLALKLAVSGFKAFDLCPDGFHAVVLVLQYGVRFTKQEKDTIAVIREIFGRDVFKKWGVIVMTYGDSFQLDHDDEGSSGTIQQKFDEWRKQQMGDIKKLFEECGDRCILFNHKSNDENVKKTQVDELNKALQSLRSGQYSREGFRRDVKTLIMSYLSGLKSDIDLQQQVQSNTQTQTEMMTSFRTFLERIQIILGELSLTYKNEEEFIIVDHIQEWADAQAGVNGLLQELNSKFFIVSSWSWGDFINWCYDFVVQIQNWISSLFSLMPMVKEHETTF